MEDRNKPEAFIVASAVDYWATLVSRTQMTQQRRRRRVAVGWFTLPLCLCQCLCLRHEPWPTSHPTRRRRPQASSILVSPSAQHQRSDVQTCTVCITLSEQTLHCTSHDMMSSRIIYLLIAFADSSKLYQFYQDSTSLEEYFLSQRRSHASIFFRRFQGYQLHFRHSSKRCLNV